MNIFTSSELASKTKSVCDTVRNEGCAFVTNNGKLDCMMVDISSFDTINDAIHLYDQLIAQHELERIRSRYEERVITAEEIDTEVDAVRKARGKKAR